jgi:hypothetical protein
VGVPVRAEFTCPGSRTIVMRITEGEGMGSLVETHATPLGLGADGRPRTMVTEATVAYSERPGFHVARWLSPLVRPGIRQTARKLWDDDPRTRERGMCCDSATSSLADHAFISIERRPATQVRSLPTCRNGPQGFAPAG